MLTVIDTDDIINDITANIDRIRRTSNVPVIAIGTFGLEPATQKEYPVFPSYYYWWLNVPLDVCMERALKRQVDACYNNFDRFVDLQRSKSSSEISAWLSEYMNMKHRGDQWKDLKSYFLNYKNDEGDLLFEMRSENEILDSLSHAIGPANLSNL